MSHTSGCIFNYREMDENGADKSIADALAVSFKGPNLPEKLPDIFASTIRVANWQDDGDDWAASRHYATNGNIYWSAGVGEAADVYYPFQKRDDGTYFYTAGSRRVTLVFQDAAQKAVLIETLNGKIDRRAVFRFDEKLTY